MLCQVSRADNIRQQNYIIFKFGQIKGSFREGAPDEVG